MTWTFSDTDISTNLAKVRLAIGDVDTNDQIVTDEIVNYYLGLYSNDIVMTAIDVIERAILPKFASDTDRNTAGISATRSQKFRQYMDLLARLRERGSRVSEVYLGGISLSDADAISTNTDLVQPAITRTRDDNDG